jgi:hypothetical protein
MDADGVGMVIMYYTNDTEIFFLGNLSTRKYSTFLIASYDLT